MAQQFVQFANRPDPDYSALLNQTQQVAAREHEVAKRMAAQRALLQQMADRGDIKVPDNQVAVGRFGMEFDNAEARKAFINSQTPEQKDLSRNDAAYSTQEVVQTAQDVAREAGAAASDAHNAMNPQMRESAQLALIQQKLAVEQSLRQAGNPGRPWVQGSLEDQPKMPDPGPNQQIATNALRDIIGMQPKPEGQPAPVVPGTGVLSPVEIGKRQAQAEAAAETPNTSQSATNKSGTAESRSARDSINVSMTPVNFNMDVTDRTKTVSSSGMQFYDEIKETLPSLRKAAAIETISAMFGGRDTNSPGQFSALAAQREKDLATYNERLAKSGTSTVYGGGLSRLSTSGGQTGMDVSDATAGSNNYNVTTNVSAGNSRSGNDSKEEPKIANFSRGDWRSRHFKVNPDGTFGENATGLDIRQMQGKQSFAPAYSNTAQGKKYDAAWKDLGGTGPVVRTKNSAGEDIVQWKDASGNVVAQATWNSEKNAIDDRGKKMARLGAWDLTAFQGARTDMIEFITGDNLQYGQGK
jgi:hypothetical protein